MRLFFSIDPPPNVQQQIHRLCPPCKDVRIMPSEQLHITLQFLDEQPTSILHDIADALAPIKIPKLTLRTTQVGHFRSGVIWLGIDRCTELERLHQKVTRALQQQQILFRQRNFIPHITLARSRRKLHSEQLRQYSAAFQSLHLKFQASPLRLKSSQLLPKGAIHRVEAEFL